MIQFFSVKTKLLVAKNTLCLHLGIPQGLMVSQMRSVFSNIVSASRELGDAAVNQKPFKVPVKNVKVLASQRMPFCMCLLRDLKEKALKAFFSIDHINFHF